MSVNTSGPESFEGMYSIHNKWLISWLCKKTGCSHHAADFAQDTFLRVLTRITQARQEKIDNPRRYLTVIAGGLVIDHFRRRAVEQAYLDVLSIYPEPVDISAEQRQDLLQTIQRVDEMLDNLPEKIRKAFLMSQIDGLTYQQIANKMDISVRTVKRYMQQGFVQCLSILL